MIDVIVTGSRDMSSSVIVYSALDGVAVEFDGIRFLVEGGCLTGADRHARKWGGRAQHRVTLEADWNEHGRAAGPIRNGDMLRRFPEAIVLAFPYGESRGTRDCIRQALALGHIVRITECR